MQKLKVGVVSLGCARNLVDSERMLGGMDRSRVEIIDGLDGADLGIINTCGFIRDAIDESTDVILQAIELKKQKRLRSIIVAGCLSERYQEKLQKELPEVDGFLGVPLEVPEEGFRRELITPPHFAYLKISDGCRNHCSYCVIPQIRGAYRSRTLESLVKEARLLFSGGAQELNLIGQDTTLYGVDRYKKPKIRELLKGLAPLSHGRWLRLLYTHPAHWDDGLLDLMCELPCICKYIDLPLQHINDRILKNMNRGVTKRHILRLLEKVQQKKPFIAVRTTFITGFPGETEKQFRELYDFIRQAHFDRMGIFTYSREEGTPAYNFKNQIPEKIKRQRSGALMKLQQEISLENNKKFLGRTLKILIDEKAKSEDNLYMGRTEYDAPEVDGSVYVRGGGIKAGSFIEAKITDTLEYDLVAQV